MSDERISRDFDQRTSDDQKELTERTWCDHCQQVDLGMTHPEEYELHGLIFIEGRCKECKEIVLTEITDDEF